MEKMEYGSKFGIWFIQFTDRSPLFKGSALILLALFALGFAYFVKKKWGEQGSFGYYLFAGVAVLILIYGLYILVVRPNWWALPY
ncbi:MAG: hypothetical protein KKH83_00415 [Candidatus Margulisbacteria bacterium]|nr:hypothetical protein [Candidatus Margulisiibacteriota bacterium]